MDNNNIPEAIEWFPITNHGQYRFCGLTYWTTEFRGHSFVMCRMPNLFAIVDIDDEACDFTDSLSTAGYIDGKRVEIPSYSNLEWMNNWLRENVKELV
jgi:hypothetical protein